MPESVRTGRLEFARFKKKAVQYGKPGSGANTTKTRILSVDR